MSIFLYIVPDFLLIVQNTIVEILVFFIFEDKRKRRNI